MHASGLSRSQDHTAFLLVLLVAVRAEAVLGDAESVFKAHGGDTREIEIVTATAQMVAAKRVRVDHDDVGAAGLPGSSSLRFQRSIGFSTLGGS